jgi:tripartite-type tricarboxylate transporter receptor subunit TctC
MRSLPETAVIGLLIAHASGAIGPASAQNYPTKPVRIITAGAGTFHDIVTRHLGQRLSERWGQPIVVENQPAGGMTIGSGIAARATPDGYTLLMADRTAFAVAPSLYKNLSYDPVKDFSPITLVARAPSILVAHASVPAANLREFIAYAKRQPGGINFAAAGPGTVSHIDGELFKQVTGVNLVSIQYKGGAASILAIVSGEVKAGFSLIPVALPHVTAGKIKAYAIAGNKRFAGAPDVPTSAEAGLPGFESEQWIGMVAPARTPAGLVLKFNRDFVEILQTPAMRDVLLAQGSEPAPGTPDAFAAFVKAETAKFKKVIEMAGIKAE